MTAPINYWLLVTKWRIQKCCKQCRKWQIRELPNGRYASYHTYDTWADALDAVVRNQTQQYFSRVNLSSVLAGWPHFDSP